MSNVRASTTKPPAPPRRRPWLKGLLAVMLVMAGGVVILLSHHLDWWAARPVANPRPFRFEDGFENAESLDDLLARDGSRWHGNQREPAKNAVAPSSEQVHSGKKALKCVAVAQHAAASSKACVELDGLHFVKEDHVWFTGWFYLQGGTDATGVFLWDLEASKKYKSPGRRLFLQSGEYLASDLGKWWGGETFRQRKDQAAPFPKDRWTRLKVHLFLSEATDGRLEVWQDERKILDATGQTLPTAKTVYDRFQVGLTANGNRRHAQTLYVDDVMLCNSELE